MLFGFCFSVNIWMHSWTKLVGLSALLEVFQAVPWPRRGNSGTPGKSFLGLLPRLSAYSRRLVS